ncbi:peptidoglycan/LPS O-acetylase OafA/YrhL [Bradyrhizobium sp. USDA 4463]
MRLLCSTQDGKNNFDAIRLGMALTVVWSHSFALGRPEGELVEPISILTNGHFNAGNVAVMVFFTISGYLICQSWVNSKTIGSFFSKRVRRIIPGYMGATMVGAFIVVPLFATVYAFSLVEIFKTVVLNLLMRNYAPPSTVFARNYLTALNGSLWSIPFEFWCYVLLAALGVVGLLKRTKFVVALAAVSMAARASFDLLDKRPGLGIVGMIFGWPYLWVFILPCFLSGVLVYLLKDRLYKSSAIAGLLLVAFLSSCYLPFGFKGQHIVAQLLFPVFTSYLTFSVAFSDRIKLRSAAKFGDFSYGTYLYAFPIQQMLVSTFSLSFPMIVLCSLFLSLTAGVLSWYLVERHFIVRGLRGIKAVPDDVGPRAKTT